jgi:hypothetical protein
LPKIFFQHEVGGVEIDKMPTRIRVQNIYIIGWTIIEEKKLNKIKQGFEENSQQVKISVDLEPIINSQLIELLKEFKDIFVWTYKDLNDIPPKIVQHQIKLDTLIPPAHQTRY